MDLDLLKNNLDNFISNENEINEFINSLQTSTNCIFLHGCCKTPKNILVKHIFKKLNIKYNYILSSNIPNKRNLNNFINNYFKTHNIYNLISNNTNKSVIIIDNLELINTADKFFFIHIAKNIKKYNKLLVLISNTDYFKFYDKITDICDEIHFNHNVNNTISSNIHQNDLFTITSNLLYNYDSVKHITNEFNNHKYLIPLLLHENYLHYLNKMKLSSKSTQNIILTIMKSYINYDYLDNYMYANQYWDLQPISGLIPCITISLYINKHLSYNKFIYDKIIYTKFLNKISLISINRKIILKLMIKFNVFNLIHLLRICHLMIDDTIFTNELMDKYHICDKNYNSIIKLNK